MSNKYLLLAATSALMFASCSDDINQGGENTPPTTDNLLKLKTLDVYSQADRITFPGQTRGPKADRLQLVAKIAPLDDAATNKWSATGIAFSNGKAYISWHSDHQASNPAETWGGALDEIEISALGTENGSVDKTSVFTRTQTLTSAKLNNVIAQGNTLYFPITDSKNGAVVGRMEIGGETIDTVAVPGSSVNAVAMHNGALYAVSGYAGGAYTINYSPAEGSRKFAVVDGTSVAEDFGGKYIAGGYVLRTNDDEAQLVSLADGSTRGLGAPLTSEEKDAESYDPATGKWTLTGNKATHFGKHTMAIADGYIYVAGGQGSNHVNGLRVYAANTQDETPVWQNGTNTTAVCVEGDYVYAATGAGLRVYQKYEAAPASGDNFKLFAYEVEEYDEQTGMAIGHAAGTSGHSGNFVAVDPTSKLIFVAYGQSGVYVFRLDPTVPEQPELEPVTVTWTDGYTNGSVLKSEEVEKGTTLSQDRYPETPTRPGYKFDGWTVNGNPVDYNYVATGDVEIKAAWKSVITFDKNGGEGNINPVDVKEGQKTTLPDGTGLTAPDGKYFDGWNTKDDGSGTTYPGGSEYTPEGSKTLYAVWTDYKYTLKFDGNTGSITGAPDATGVPATIHSNDKDVTVPNGTPVCGNLTFCGWSTNKDLKVTTDGWQNQVYLNKEGFNNKYTFASEDGEEVTLYAIWGAPAFVIVPPNTNGKDE